MTNYEQQRHGLISYENKKIIRQEIKSLAEYNCLLGYNKNLANDHIKCFYL